MALPEERKENLKKLVGMTADEGILNEIDALAIINVCLEACEREKADAYEQFLTEKIGGDV